VFGLTSKGSIVGQFQRALAKRDVLAVRSLAGELPSVPLPVAAEITVLLLEREPESYAPAARRLLARLASECPMPLRQLADVATLLAELEADPPPAVAGKRLCQSLSELRRKCCFAWKAVVLSCGSRSSGRGRVAHIASWGSTTGQLAERGVEWRIPSRFGRKAS
jgi:hypothetical protein